jgi:hypothetical protein
MLQPNLGIVTTKLCNDAIFSHVLITDKLIDKGFLSDTTSTSAFLAPLYIYNKGNPSINLTSNYLQEIEQKYPELKLTPENHIAFLYGWLNSPLYQKRFYEFFRIGYPRVLFPDSPEDFSAILQLGQQLIELHLGKSLPRSPGILIGEGSNCINQVTYSNEQIWINNQQSFNRVTPEAWNFKIGPYQTLSMWLKYRKGRILDQPEIYLFCNLIGILTESIEIKKTLDSILENIFKFESV